MYRLFIYIVYPLSIYIVSWSPILMLQPVVEKMRLEMVIGMQNEILIGIKKIVLCLLSNFQIKRDLDS